MFTSLTTAEANVRPKSTGSSKLLAALSLFITLINFSAVLCLMLTANLIAGKVAVFTLLGTSFIENALLLYSAFQLSSPKSRLVSSYRALQSLLGMDDRRESCVKNYQNTAWSSFLIGYALINTVATCYLVTFVPQGMRDTYTFLGLIFLVAMHGVVNTVVAATNTAVHYRASRRKTCLLDEMNAVENTLRQIKTPIPASSKAELLQEGGGEVMKITRNLAVPAQISPK